MTSIACVLTRISFFSYAASRPCGDRSFVSRKRCSIHTVFSSLTANSFEISLSNPVIRQHHQPVCKSVALEICNYHTWRTLMRYQQQEPVSDPQAEKYLLLYSLTKNPVTNSPKNHLFPTFAHTYLSIHHPHRCKLLEQTTDSELLMSTRNTRPDDLHANVSPSGFARWPQPVSIPSTPQRNDSTT